MIKVIAVDFGGVYFNWKVEKFWAEVSRRFDLDYEAVKQADKAHIRDFHVRKVTVKEYWDRFCSTLGKDMDHDTLSKITLGIFKPKKPVIELVKRLRKKYKIALLSNHTIHLDYLDKKYGIYKDFDIPISSHLVGVQKPDREIYELLLKKSKAKPEEIVFIDDQERNLIPAREMGINCILFRNVRQLRKELAALGVKS